jgi:hypothetical protein
MAWRAILVCPCHAVAAERRHEHPARVELGKELGDGS